MLGVGLQCEMSVGGGRRVCCRVAPAALGEVVSFPCIYVVCVAVLD